jgi:hypothetical protein
MPVPPHVEAAFRKSLTDTLAYYTSMPGDHQPQIAAIQTALSLEIGNPASREGVDLASKYYNDVKAGRIQKPRMSRKSMTSSQRAVSNAINLLELVQSKSHPQRGRISQLKAALNMPLPRSSTNATLSQRRERLRLSQKRVTNREPVPYNIRAFNARRTTGRSTFAPRVGSRLAANARRQLRGEPVHETALDEANDAALQFLRNLGEHY